MFRDVLLLITFKRKKNSIIQHKIITLLQILPFTLSPTNNFWKAFHCHFHLIFIPKKIKKPKLLLLGKVPAINPETSLYPLMKHTYGANRRREPSPLETVMSLMLTKPENSCFQCILSFNVSVSSTEGHRKPFFPDCLVKEASFAGKRLKLSDDHKCDVL